MKINYSFQAVKSLVVDVTILHDPVGEIMIAALPASLKLQSESVYLPNSKFYSDNKLQKLKLQEQTIIDALEHNEKLSLREISEILDLKFPHIYIQNLLNKGWIKCYESHSEKYKPKTITKISLNPKFYQDESLMEEAFNNLSKAPKQEALLLEFLKINQDLNRESIDKKKLLNQTLASPGLLKALIDKEILYAEKEQVGRIKNSFAVRKKCLYYQNINFYP